MLDRLRRNIQLVSHPLFDFPIIFKFAKFPWQIPYFEAETAAYEWIKSTNIGPKFLGQITEAGRVTGWVMEDLGRSRTAEPGDLAACQEVLRQLHSLGIEHGDINRFKLLAKTDEAHLIDLETAEKWSDVVELEAEYRRLVQSLDDPSFRGGIGPVVFFDHVDLPKELRTDTQPSLKLLQALHIHSISTFPYENLSLHYNAAHSIEIDPQRLFRKMITDNRGRGGFCLEIAIFYNHILRAIGFDAYTAGVRTRARLEGEPHGEFPGWNHIVNIITLPDGTKYHSDVAFGGDGPTMPMPLVDGLVHQNLGTQQIRLKRDWIPHQVHKVEETKLWIYQYRNSSSREWNSFYSFPGTEFYALDWGVVNWWINTHPDSHQRRNLLTIKFLQQSVESGKDFEGQREIHGKRMLVNGVVKENLGGKTQVIFTCRTEEQRVEALGKYFQIFLTDEEKGGIRGYVSELPPTPRD
ncbi:hypothetical protein HJFPF1_07135 [Paramyrothecium foliicola]|nr:hypothetical protein HJFPF1_07135 [Paramyrothecium foliicola]